MGTDSLMTVLYRQEYSTLVHFGGLELRVRWLPTLLLAFLVPLFLGLGVWQLERAEEKRELALTFAARRDLPPVPLGALVTDPEQLRFRRLQATGQFDASGQILIENRRYGGKTGFHVITPLRLAGSDVHVLVNRGWVPAGANAAVPPVPVPGGVRTVLGEAYIPMPPALALGSGTDLPAVWGKRWPYLTVELFASVVGYPVQPLVILQDPRDADGFVRDWPRELPKEGMHLGYALQWFAFAAITLVLYLRFSLVRRGAVEAGG